MLLFKKFQLGENFNFIYSLNLSFLDFLVIGSPLSSRSFTMNCSLRTCFSRFITDLSRSCIDSLFGDWTDLLNNCAVYWNRFAIIMSRKFNKAFYNTLFSTLLSRCFFLLFERKWIETRSMAEAINPLICFFLLFERKWIETHVMRRTRELGVFLSLVWEEVDWNKRPSNIMGPYRSFFLLFERKWIETGPETSNFDSQMFLSLVWEEVDWNNSFYLVIFRFILFLSLVWEEVDWNKRPSNIMGPYRSFFLLFERKWIETNIQGHWR